MTNTELNGEEPISVAGDQNTTPTVDPSIESTSTATEVKPEENQNNTEQPVIEPANGSGQEPKKDGPWGKTDLEKATYSFHKQLARKDKQHAQEMQKLLDRIEKLEHPEKYKPKTRADFPLEKGGDDQYINYLVDEKVKALFNSQLEAWRKEQEEEESRKAVDEEYRAKADENIKKLYPTPEAEKDFRDTVRMAMDQGLGELLDADENLSNYILTSPIGPAIMYKLASSKDSVAKLFDGARNSMDLQFRIRDLEREVQEEIKAKELQTIPPAPATQQTTPPKAAPKPLGKPGIEKAGTKDIFSDRDALLDFIRS